MSKTINTIVLVCMLLICLGSEAMAQLKDAKGSKDHELFTRMPDYKIYQYQDKEFDVHKFRVKSGGSETAQSVEGRLYYIKYVFDKSTGSTSPSKLQILKNYQNAAAKVGGATVFENPNVVTLKISKDQKNIWVEVASVATGTEYTLYIVEEQAMKQDVVANAAALKAGLAESGHVELQGVFFDTGKSDLKPESETALKEIAKMLQQSPELKVWVVGHTDYVGTAESNLTLSGARAASVVKYLVTTLGIDAKRMGSFGAGPYAPVAPNNTEEGRAKNRRVELVLQP
jgi:OOP family OmpA-OmpF porin